MFQRFTRTLELVAAGIIGAVFTSLIAIAWTGPTSAPPSGNVDAPLNVGDTDQIKNAGLGLNSLAVFGNTILSGTSRYLNFGTQPGASGYGLRDNAGTMEFKNSGGNWQNLLSPASVFQQITFADGTTQTTAGGASRSMGSLNGYCQESLGQTFGPNLGHNGCIASLTISPAACAGTANAPCTCASGYTLALTGRASAYYGGTAAMYSCVKQ